MNTSWISDPFGVVMVLLAIEGGIFALTVGRRTKKLFNFLPPMFWIYFLPMIATTCGLIPAKSETYSFITKHVLPMSLVLLLISVDIRAILRLGGLALTMVLVGSLGTMVGGPVSLWLVHDWLHPQAWMGFGALSGSWIGGSANMVAVAQGIGTPDEVFGPMVIVDTVVAYGWMGLLIALAKFQTAFDRWNKSDTRVMEQLSRKLSAMESSSSEVLSLPYAAMILAVGAVAAWTAGQLGAMCPEVKNLVSTYTWTIVIVSAIGIALSFTPVRRLESHGASKLGYTLLYLVLASIGAKADLSGIESVPLLVAAGIVWIVIHGAFLLVAARLLRVPMFLAVTASQANVGGPASAPVVAGVYQPALATVGLLMAIVGNLLGTYLGILCSQICRWVVQ